MSLRAFMGRSRAYCAPCALALTVLLTRLPFLHLGFGWDADAAGNVMAARTTALTPNFDPGRPPGYPVLVGIYALLWPLHPYLINAISGLFSALSAAGFYLVLRHVGAKAVIAFLAGLAIAFVPSILINSTVPMDYVWALAFAVWALWCALRKQPLAAGLLLGIATGCRLTSLLMIVPLGVLLADRAWCSPPSLRRVGKFAAATLGACIGLFAPVVAARGWGHLTFSNQDVYELLPSILMLPTVMLWGVTGLAAWIVAAISFAVRPRWSMTHALLDLRQNRRLFISAIAAVGLITAAFIRLPVEAAYLIPAVPFAFLIAAMTLHRRVFTALAVATLLSPLFLHLKRDFRDLALPADRREVTGAEASSFTRWSPRLFRWQLKGPLLLDDRFRRNQEQCLLKVFEVLEKSPRNKVVVRCEGYHEELVTLHPMHERLASRKSVVITNHLARTDVRGLLDQGCDVFHVQMYDDLFLLVYRAELDAAGTIVVVPEFIAQQNAKGTLSTYEPSALDRMLMLNSMDPESDGAYYRQLLNATFFVPVAVREEHTGTRLEPEIIFYDGRRCLMAFDQPSQMENLSALRRPSDPFIQLAGADLLAACPGGVDLVTGFGLVTECRLSSDVLDQLRDLLNIRAK